MFMSIFLREQFLAKPCFRHYSNFTQIKPQALLKYKHHLKLVKQNFYPQVLIKLTHKRYSKLLKISFKLIHKRYSN